MARLPCSRAKQQLRDLHRVRRRALAQLVADDPEVEAAGMGQVLADPPHEAVVLTLDERGHGIPVVGRLVPQTQAGEAREELARALRADLLVGLGVDGEGGAGEDGYPDGRGSDLKV